MYFLPLRQIAYLRGLFRPDIFTEVSLPSLDGLSVRVLDGSKNPEASRLVAWLEDGAGDALAKRYLQRLYFCVAKASFMV